ncbi:NAD(P)/FAD-dependent oxidoreductase [Streptococcus pyogenes]|uniref:NAD(P)/FAD-dependent oxidoreductase n=1 Tax=Streptococcus pyogenes TaxID=1314 RepID=UPI00109D23A2|nr:FAD-dependent oxidoreductase [Streptococcus pyogenes]VGQ94668.1 oxidoreductase [Streptococcus pyogenes]VGR20809.1 oxidoreductase [Streptococcus pyogenes]VGR28411.1 oxidoreductase [Streptococcus pyogenes]VGR87286.1 oxidoreductase [Streptococcus pyogenes]VGR92019.1 oxidoreductase [Streptococcus pyogenes]
MKIAIIGAGIVGSTAAYYLQQSGQKEVTIFDHGQGQATKAAAGIISPWFSKRRNKVWYRMARLGADFYQELVSDLQTEGFATDFYQQNGIYLLKKQEEKLKDLYQLALSRQEESPLIGHLEVKKREEIQEEAFPGLVGFDNCLYASGAARVEGAALCETLLKASGYPVIRQKVTLKQQGSGYEIAGHYFDQVILAAGAWLPDLLRPLGYQVDVRPQKGQLLDYDVHHIISDNYPVVMPEGEIDLIPFNQGKISVGASHENDKGYDLEPDWQVLEKLEMQALTYLPLLKEATQKTCRVGIRAYTSDYSPFYGQVPGLKNLYTASGLGSSGLTVGPLIGYELAQLLLGHEGLLTPSDYSPEPYLLRSTGKA